MSKDAPGDALVLDHRDDVHGTRASGTDENVDVPGAFHQA
jgi:hypothetical protein